jgi:NAD(P)-dependent dehydrogenase (short-subunit alcohol dehydrogenase family)
VVTGGSKGIGLAVAAELVREGADVAICSRHGDELDAAAGELRAGGATVHAQVADVTDPGQVTDFIDAAAAALGGIDVLVNNAGAAHGPARSPRSPTRTGGPTWTSSSSPRSAAPGPRFRTCGAAGRPGW